jgi:hypothetical protein
MYLRLARGIGISLPWYVAIPAWMIWAMVLAVVGVAILAGYLLYGLAWVIAYGVRQLAALPGKRSARRRPRMIKPVR